MKTNFRIQSLLALLALSACEIKVPEAKVIVEAPESRGDAPSVDIERGAPEPQPSPTATIEARSVFRNYGFMEDDFPLNFTDSRFHQGNMPKTLSVGGEARRYYWRIYEPGFSFVSGREIGICMADVQVIGSEVVGIIRMTNSIHAWRSAAYLQMVTEQCASFDGDYPFEVTSEGLWFDGELYTEVQ